MAQSTPDASFGPFFLTWQWACKVGNLRECWLFVVEKVEIKAKYISQTKKVSKRNKKNTYYNGPNDARRVVWAFF